VSSDREFYTATREEKGRERKRDSWKL